MKKYILLLTLLYLFTFSFNAKLKINQNDEPEEDNETEVKDKYCQEELIELNIPEQAIIDSKTNISIPIIIEKYLNETISPVKSEIIQKLQPPVKPVEKLPEEKEKTEGEAKNPEKIEGETKVPEKTEGETKVPEEKEKTEGEAKSKVPEEKEKTEGDAKPKVTEEKEKTEGDAKPKVPEEKEKSEGEAKPKVPEKIEDVKVPEKSEEDAKKNNFNPNISTQNKTNYIINDKNYYSINILSNDYLPRDAWWEGWNVIPKSFWINKKFEEGKDFISLKINDKYISCDNNSVISASNEKNEYALFSVHFVGENFVHLQSYFGGYLNIEDDGIITCNRREKNNASTFNIIKSNKGCQVDDANFIFLRGTNGKYLAIRNNKVESDDKEYLDENLFKGNFYDEKDSVCNKVALTKSNEDQIRKLLNEKPRPKVLKNHIAERKFFEKIKGQKIRAQILRDKNIKNKQIKAQKINAQKKTSLLKQRLAPKKGDSSYSLKLRKLLLDKKQRDLKLKQQPAPIAVPTVAPISAPISGPISGTIPGPTSEPIFTPIVAPISSPNAVEAGIDCPLGKNKKVFVLNINKE